MDSFVAKILMTFESPFKKHASEPSVYTVSELNQAVSELLGLEFGLVWIKGEVSSFTRAAGGDAVLTSQERRLMSMH